MISETAGDKYAHEPRGQADCEECGRSIISRFGDDDLLYAVCDSCEADFKRLHEAGKIQWLAP